MTSRSRPAHPVRPAQAELAALCHRRNFAEKAGKPLDDVAAPQPVANDAVVRFAANRLRAHADRTVRLRFAARQARLYSYRFAAPAKP